MTKPQNHDWVHCGQIRENMEPFVRNLPTAQVNIWVCLCYTLSSSCTYEFLCSAQASWILLVPSCAKWISPMPGHRGSSGMRRARVNHVFPMICRGDGHVVTHTHTHTRTHRRMHAHTRMHARTLKSLSVLGRNGGHVL